MYLRNITFLIATRVDAGKPNVGQQYHGVRNLDEQTLRQELCRYYTDSLEPTTSAGRLKRWKCTGKTGLPWLRAIHPSIRLFLPVVSTD